MNQFLAEYQRLLDSLLKDILAGQSRSILFHASDSAAFSTYLDKYLEGLESRPLILRASLEKGRIQPFYPFIQWIRQRLSGHKPDRIDEILELAGVYSQQKSIFQSYIQEGHASRFEELIPDELEYERGRMIDSLWKLFNELFGNMPLIVVLENLEMGTYSAVEFLNTIITRSSKNPVLFILSGNIVVKLNEGDRRNTILETIQEIEMNSITVDFGPRVRSQMIHHTYEDLGRYPDEEILTARDCFHFLALQDCRDLAQALYNNRITTPGSMPFDSEALLLETLGDVSYYLGDFDSALVHYHALLNLAQKQNDLAESAVSYRKIGLTYSRKDNIESAEKNAWQSLKIAQKLEDRRLIFYAFFLIYLIEDKGRKQSIAQWRESNVELVRLGRELNYENMLSFLFTNPYGVYSQYQNEEETYHNLGIEIASRNGNEFRLATAYQTMGLVYAVKGDYTKVFHYYNLSEKLKKKLANPLELSYIYNGMGFYYYMTGDYDNAQDNFQKALKLLRKVREYHEIGMTFFNLAATYFLAFHHEGAILYLEKLLQLLTIMNIQNLSYHSLFGIYCLLGVCYCKTGNYSKAYEYSTRIRVNRLSPYPLKNEEYFLYCLLNALLNRNEGNQKAAGLYYNGCRHFLNKTNDVIKYLGPRFKFEYAEFLKETGDSQKAGECWKIGYEKALEMGHSSYQQIFRALMSERRLELPLVNVRRLGEGSFEWIMETARMEISLMKLHRKMNEIHFLNTFQTLATRRQGRDELIRQALDLIHNSFLIDNIYFYSWNSGVWNSVYQRVSKAPEKDVMPLVRFFATDTRERFLENVSEFQDIAEIARPFYSLISLPLVIGEKRIGLILCAVVERHPGLTVDDAQVLSIASKQLGVAMEKVEQEEEIIEKNQELYQVNLKLQLAATTDMLTQLYNRAALHRKLEEERNRIIRYENKGGHAFSVLFIDMDNFKFYNDTYGHKVGDLILREFGQLLKNQSRDVDFTSRYGGDEFVLLLPETGRDGAIRMAERIFDSLRDRRGFIPEMEKYLGYPLQVPVGKQLSCSIGIAEYNSTENPELEALIQKADIALYEAKRRGKKRYWVYGDSVQA